MHVQTYSVALTTDASGAATGYSEQLNGLLDRIQYVKNDFADGVGFTLTLEDTGETLWAEAAVNASAVRAPRQPTHTPAGAAALYAAGGVAVNDRIAVSGKAKIVIASGGDTKSGTFVITTI
jgi:hypothetical protein